jgi:hypothetical protein
MNNTIEETKDIKEFRAFDRTTNKLTYFDFIDVKEGNITLDFDMGVDGCNTIITSFTGRMDNSDTPIPLYEGDILKVIKTNILTGDDVKIGIIEFSPNYSAYVVVFQTDEPKLLCNCYENTIIRKGSVFDEQNWR